MRERKGEEEQRSIKEEQEKRRGEEGKYFDEEVE
jgi:hypothetical protein